ncbi:MAG TPA: ATP-binding protein [Gemmataceae bacterium]
MDERRSPVSPDRNVPAGRWELRPDELGPEIDPAGLGFRTTDELEPLEEVVGQERALRALEFGLGVRHRGYNVYVSGMTGTGRKELLQRLLEARAAGEPTPDDWVYVHNFDEPDRPLALRLPSGHGVRLRDALEQVIDRLRHDLPAALKAKDFDAERERLAAAFGRRSEELFNALVEHARRLDMAIRRLPNGVIVFVPLKDGRPMEPQELEKLSDEERADIERRQMQLGELAAELMAEQQELSHQMREEIQEIVRGFARRIIEPLIARVKSEHPGEALAAWLDRVQGHLLDHLERLQEEPREEVPGLPAVLRAALEREDRWLEYRVNVVADRSRARGAPVVVESSPTYKNLFGTIEHDVNLFGRVSANFTRIKPGSLLRASGGYLVFDMEDALTEPLVWKQLKRALKSGQLLTDVYEPLALLAATALKPQPIPIDTKVVVLGSAELYYLLQFLDEDFRELFRVRADFGPETRRDADGHRAYARFIARQVRAEGLPPFDAAAVAEVIRFGVREAAHQGKLSVEFGVVADLVREAGHWARQAGAAAAGAEHVRRALDERVYRSDRIAAKVRELIDEGILRISIEGSRAGQVNGLAVWDLGDYRFGRPSRVTASVGVGREGLVNIERESDLSGSTHDKGVLILEGYLRNRYAARRPLALSASLTFEQSYGWVEGDSASAAELFCLLSALSGVPLRQDIAVTGSVNQHGEVQAVGGVNEKIEGFYDVCRVKGLTGTQGVLIPRSNVRHLVLRRDVIDAVREGRFHVWAIDTIDEGIELLTGLPAGDVDQEGTFHYLLDQRFQEILSALQELPTPAAAPRVRLGPGAPPKPSPPPLPGERG